MSKMEMKWHSFESPVAYVFEQHFKAVMTQNFISIFHRTASYEFQGPSQFHDHGPEPFVTRHTDWIKNILIRTQPKTHHKNQRGLEGIYAHPSVLSTWTKYTISTNKQT